MSQDSDPVGNGFVVSLARPGRNVTGLSTLAPEIRGKQLELLKEIVSRLSRVAVFETSTQPGNAQALKEVDLVAGAFGVKLQYLDVLSPKDIETAFRAAVRARADAVLMMVVRDVLPISRRKVDSRPRCEEPAAGDISAERSTSGRRGAYELRRERGRLDRRAATYVDKILKGRKPADLPCRAADQIRVHHQSASGEADWIDDSAHSVGKSGSGDQMNKGNRSIRQTGQ